MAIMRTTVPAAAGYPQYSGNLTHPIIGLQLIERFYASTVFGEIATTEYIGELSKGGDQITFFREPSVLIRDSIKGGTIKHDTLEAEPVTLTIDQAKEFSYRIDKIDIKQMQVWETMKGALLKNAARAMANNIDGQLLGQLYTYVAPTNTGPQAGAISGQYNLGTAGAPITITPANAVQALLNLGGVLNEAQIPREGRWVVLPSIFENALLNSDLKPAYLTGMDKSPILNGRIPLEVGGLTVYVSDHVARVFDTGVNKWAYHVPCGTKQGIVFASQLEDTRVIEDADSWSELYQGRMVYGWGVIQPTSISDLYVTF